jgi:hypothetical protein
MKKTKTRLQLSKVTVRVLGETEMVMVRGGGGAALLGKGSPSNDPSACVASPYGAEQL